MSHRQTRSVCSAHVVWPCLAVSRLVDVDSRTPLPLALSPRRFLLALSSSKRPEQIGKVGYSRLNTSFVAVKLIDIVAVLIGFCGLRDFDPSIGQRKHV